MTFFDRDSKYKTTRDKRREKRIFLDSLLPRAQKIIVFTVLVIAITAIAVTYMRYTADNFAIINSLERQYNDEFEIVSSESNRRRILYNLVSEKGIEFSAFKTKAEKPIERKNDYKEQLIKKFATEYFEKRNVDYIKIKEENIFNLSVPKLDVYINKYSEIEESINTLYNLKDYITVKSAPYIKDETVVTVTFGNIFIKDFWVAIPQNSEKSSVIDVIKSAYVNNMIDQNMENEEVTQEEIDKYINTLDE